MNSRQAIKLAIDMADMVSQSYLEDLTDQEMMQPPLPRLQSHQLASGPSGCRRERHAHQNRAQHHAAAAGRLR